MTVFWNRRSQPDWTMADCILMERTSGVEESVAKAAFIFDEGKFLHVYRVIEHSN
jgi:hypothetical protein